MSNTSESSIEMSPMFIDDQLLFFLSYILMAILMLDRWLVCWRMEKCKVLKRAKTFLVVVLSLNIMLFPYYFRTARIHSSQHRKNIQI